MADKFESDLDMILDGFDKAEKVRQAGTQRRKAEEDTFESEFAAIRQNVIRPVFQSTLDRLKERGHDGRITEQGYSEDHQGRPSEASIQLLIYPGGKDPDRRSDDMNYPHLAYIGDRRARGAFSHVSNMTPGRGGSAGSKAKYHLNQITAEVVKGELMSLLKEVLI